MRLPPHRPAVRTQLSALLSSLVLATVLPLATVAPAGAGSTSAAGDARRALVDARDALAGDGGDPGTALRVLHRVLPRLGAADPGAVAEAHGLLARPTAGAADARGDGYAVPATRRCAARSCLHWVRTTRDAPPDQAWARTTLDVVDGVLEAQVDELGYRAPLPDGRRGGDERLDVYLADVGARGLYGYCAPEDPPGDRGGGTATAYCVLDDDFAREQFGAAPRRGLEVTAAHELSHAVQMAYDAGEDGWLHESTATWMEERLADAADDNRRYLPFGQLRRPGVPLDLFDPSGYAHYGNWIFWEHLTDRFGDDVVREVWERAAVDAGDDYSVEALRRVMRERGARLPRVLGRYAAANLAREQEYSEGDAWPPPRPAATARVARPVAAGRAAAPVRAEVDVDHLSSAAVVLRLGPAGQRLRPGRWALRVVVDGPRRQTRPLAWLVVRRGEQATLRRVNLDAEGVGAAAVPVPGRIDSVAVTLVNASSRYRCGRPDPTWACGGTPRDDDRRFVVEAFLSRR